jgi:hypothetical protein
MTTSKSHPSVSRRSVIKGFGATAGAGLLAMTNGTRISAQEKNAVTYTPDVLYAEVDGQPLMIDIASSTDREAPHPAVIVIHPGGMVVGDRTWMEEFTRGLAEAGYVAFSDYSVLSHVDAKSAPFLILQGTKDSMVPIVPFTSAGGRPTRERSRSGLWGVPRH